jgi:hypothetical protein
LETLQASPEIQVATLNPARTFFVGLSGASTKSFVKFAAVQETADGDQTTNIDRDRKSRD